MPASNDRVSYLAIRSPRLLLRYLRLPLGLFFLLGLLAQALLTRQTLLERLALLLHLSTCPQRRHLEKNATQMPAISWWQRSELRWTA